MITRKWKKKGGEKRKEKEKKKQKEKDSWGWRGWGFGNKSLELSPKQWGVLPGNKEAGGSRLR